MDKVKVLFLAANPADTQPLHLDEEIRQITAKVRSSEHRESLELVSRWAVRPDDLMQALLEEMPQVVHFSGHGSPAQELLLLDDRGNPRPVSQDALVNLFRILRDNVRVIVLNAYGSRPQAEALADIIGCTIGMNRPIGDAAATVFAASFYRTLGFGRSVQLAFDLGKVALRLEGIAEDEAPELFVRRGVDAATTVLIAPPTPRSADVNPPRNAPDGGPAKGLRTMDRPTFAKTLGALAPPTLDLFVASLDDAAVHLDYHGSVPEKAAELIRWAESPTGPGLEAIKRAFQGFWSSPPRTDVVSKELIKVLPEKYAIQRTLGVGAISQVMLAHDKQLDRPVAIKVLTDPESATLFDDAVRQAVKVTKHPNILSIYGAWLDNRPHHYIREYVDGKSLRSILNQYELGPPIAFIHQVLAALGDAMSFAQEQTANDLDIKPEKILIRTLPRKNRHINSSIYNIIPDMIRVEGFGRVLDPRSRESLIYCPPEISRDPTCCEVDRERANQYRLGIIGYEMLVGSERFGRLARARSKVLARMLRRDGPDDLPELRPVESFSRRNCPRFLGLAVEKMTRSKPSDRFDTLSEAVNELAHRDLDVEVARDSYRRILEDDAKERGFFHTFYDRFLKRCPDAAGVFEAKGFPSRRRLGDRGTESPKAKWPRQYVLLKHAIVMMLAFKMLGETEEPTILKTIADRHKALEFPREFYDAFRDALLETVLEFDEDSGSGLQRGEVRDAWARAIQPGIDYMKNY
jgi:serine/threonine protein kinase